MRKLLLNELENQKVREMARSQLESSEHDQLILMMARHFKQLGYYDIKADIPNWTQPDYIYWSNNPNVRYIPDLSCRDTNGVLVLLEAETCSTLNIQHTREQFKIFSAHARNKGGRFEVVVPRVCSDQNTRTILNATIGNWGIHLDNVWTPTP